MNILHLEPERYSSEALSRLKLYGDVYEFSCHSQSELISILEKKEYDVIFVKLGLCFGKDILQLQPRLKYVVTPTTGLNHIDTDAYKEAGIEIICLKGESKFLENIKSTAEHTWGLLLTLVRQTIAAHQSVLDGYWSRNDFIGMELNGKTLGIIGYGRLGKMVARYGIAFGMEVLVNDINDTIDINGNKISRTTLPKLLKNSDVISLHIPYADSNKKYINNDKIGMMKNKVIFLNTSRGEVVCEKALLNGLKSGKIGGAALDVLYEDSSWDGYAPRNQKLIDYANSHKNLLLTPHIGGYAKESIINTRNFIVDKFISIAHKGY
ncbi:MAG: hydroxyacid dehydrogenase [Candidatus Brocadiales bacterium]|nr:hydroxyacid dehydrogenase [Candidatus Brocadiales bacterium]